MNKKVFRMAVVGLLLSSCTAVVSTSEFTIASKAVDVFDKNGTKRNDIRGDYTLHDYKSGKKTNILTFKNAEREVGLIHYEPEDFQGYQKESIGFVHSVISGKSIVFEYFLVFELRNGKLHAIRYLHGSEFNTLKSSAKLDALFQSLMGLSKAVVAQRAKDRVVLDVSTSHEVQDLFECAKYRKAYLPR